MVISTGFLSLVGGAIMAPDAPTCNGNVYDFFVVPIKMAPAVLKVQTVGDDGCTPTRPFSW